MGTKVLVGALRSSNTPTRRVWIKPLHSMRQIVVAEPSPSLMLPISPTARLRAKARMERMAKARGRARKARVRLPQKQRRRTRVLWWSPLARNRRSRIRMTNDPPLYILGYRFMVQVHAASNLQVFSFDSPARGLVAHRQINFNRNWASWHNVNAVFLLL